ncbi:PASTA domain-containing protein [Ralstonia sp. UNC404CL21Col]|uniref:PASTA domain-containing protein n=1 Tax=Ralstonia sp. UNC404CL21Col TaxID=1380362 RepID=UPI0012DF97E5|nr:PASTA domain-containing protein [Ralstonia sp. UNC404CL21Col]
MQRLRSSNTGHRRDTSRLEGLFNCRSSFPRMQPRHSFSAFTSTIASNVLHGTALTFGLALTLQAAAQTGMPALRVVSELKDIRMKAVAALPKAGGDAGDRDSCPQLVIKPKSPAAKQVAAQGWAVMADVPLGAFRAVSFAGQMQAATSGTCNVTQGNVAVFQNDKLVALAYGKSAEDPAIGALTPLEGGAVRVWDGDISPLPVGDLRVDSDGTLRLSKVADEDAVCQGRALVPNVYNMSIDKARKALADKGWKPVKGGASPEPRQAALVKRGIGEANSCAGTGLAYCDFNYVGPAGKLTLTTVGEDDLPHVAGYDVRCR